MTTQALAPQNLTDESVLALVTQGDCARLSPAQKLAYYKARCDAAGIDYRTAPFQFLRLNGKEILYALKAATDQLAAKHGVRCEIVDQRTETEIRVVTVRAICQDGRQTDEIGAVSVKGLQGEALCNALMKAVTKAKRRAVLSVTGLGMLDETELETIPGATAPAPAVSALPTPRRKSEKQDAQQADLTPALRASVAAAQESRGAAPAVAPATSPEDGSSSDGASPPADIDDVMPNESDLKSLYAARRKSAHPEDVVKAYMRARYGVESSKQLTLRQLVELRDRLADPTELA